MIAMRLEIIKDAADRYTQPGSHKGRSVPGAIQLNDYQRLEAVSKPDPTPDGGVAAFFKMLTYH
jgi:hypothetical protein